MSLVHLHLLLNHVPVVGILFVVVVLIAAQLRHNGAMARLALLMLAGIGVVTMIVYFTGEPAEEAVEKLAGVSERTIHAHEEAAEISFIVTSLGAAFALGVLWLYRKRELSRAATTASLAVALVISGMMGWTANLGGQIRHTEMGGAPAAAATSHEEEAEGR